MTVLAEPPADPTVTPAQPSRPLSKDEWIARELAKHPGLTPAQEALGRRLKRDLADTGR